MQLHKYKDPTKWKFKCNQRALKPGISKQHTHSEHIRNPFSPMLSGDTQFPKCLQTHSRFQNKLAGI